MLKQTISCAVEQRTAEWRLSAWTGLTYGIVVANVCLCRLVPLNYDCPVIGPQNSAPKHVTHHIQCAAKKRPPLNKYHYFRYSSIFFTKFSEVILDPICHYCCKFYPQCRTPPTSNLVKWGTPNLIPNTDLHWCLWHQKQTS